MPPPLCNSSGKFLSIEIDSEITDEKLGAITNHIQQTAMTFGKVRLILVIKHYPTLNSAEDLYYDLRFIKLLSHQIEKVAVIADKSWKRTWVGLFGLFSGVEIDFFADTDRHLASSWIQKS